MKDRGTAPAEYGRHPTTAVTNITFITVVCNLIIVVSSFPLERGRRLNRFGQEYSRELYAMIRHAPEVGRWKSLWVVVLRGGIQRTQDEGEPGPWQDLTEPKRKQPVV